MFSIYKITNSVNGKIYIGQTTYTMHERFIGHCYGKSNCLKLIRAINRYGRENFILTLMTVCGTIETANYWETYFIQRYNSIKQGYNIKHGGANGPHSAATRRKLSKSLKGRKFTEEHKRKIAVSKIGKPRSQEVKDSMSKRMKGKYSGNKNPFYGKKHTQKTIDELKKIDHSGSKNAMFGKKHSNTMKEKSRQTKIKNGSVKITIEKARQIRIDDRKYPIIAKEFGISTTTVCNIKKNKIWKENE
jgi:group I intron endonuclease